jgi:choline dehydrogenase-like flavoprotein
MPRETSNVAEGCAFVTAAGLDAPDVQLLFAPVLYINHGLAAPPEHGFTVGVVLLTPESTGTVVVRSHALDSHRKADLMPTADVDGDAELATFVRATAETLYHPVGTCRMGIDASAVVDPELRVRGIDALRVVDASEMPVIPRGNTNAPTIMIAEKAADLLRATGRPVPRATVGTTG